MAAGYPAVILNLLFNIGFQFSVFHACSMNNGSPAGETSHHLFVPCLKASFAENLTIFGMMEKRS
jgi:hypothetical protein